MRCWNDLFLRFDQRNHKCTYLIFFLMSFIGWRQIIQWMIDMVTNYFASLSDNSVEIIHSIIWWRTAKFFTAQQLKKEARFIFQHRKDNTFRQHFIDSMKYPYTPKQLHVLSRKCAVLLLDVFTKIYQARNQHPLITKTSSNGINSYKLPSLA